MGLDYVPVIEFGLERTAAVFTRGFSDYLVKIAASPVTLLQMVRSDSVDFFASRIVVRDGHAVGAALIARRGWTCRLAGMALIPEARRQGIGRATVLRLIEEARARGDRAMVLEVIEQNTAAVRLYETCGFTKTRRLVGFARPAGKDDAAPAAAGELREVDVHAVATMVTSHGLGDLPWQLSGETLAQLSPPARGYALEGAWVALSNLEHSPSSVRALVTEKPFQGRGRGAALLRAVTAKHAGNEWRIAAIWPEELGAVFLEAGFARTPLTQWQMMRDLQ